MRFLTYLSMLLLLVNLYPSTAIAQKITYKTCMQISKKINSTYPMTVNRHVVAYSSYCSGISNTPSLHYIYHTQFQNLEAGEHKRLKNIYCTGKKTRLLLEILASVHLHYFSPSGVELAEITISESDCS
jgi:hypothetical protein